MASKMHALNMHWLTQLRLSVSLHEPRVTTRVHRNFTHGRNYEIVFARFAASQVATFAAKYQRNAQNELKIC